MSDVSPAEIPEALVAAPRRRLSAIWLIPLLAAGIGIWLTWKTVHDKGPLITITFRSADGLEAKKTKVKFRDLDIGVVEAIELSPDLSQVVVKARMQPSVKNFITDGARFWVVRARVTAAGVTGVNTLLSGAYIGIDPGTPGQPALEYAGLEQPPLVTSHESGRRFVLHSQVMGSLAIGVPVYFRQVPVGEVVRAELDPSGSQVNVDVFVRSPYDMQVHEGSRFWNTSGFDATVDKDGLHLETESLISMVIGGVAFDTPIGDLSSLADEGRVFQLYPDKRSLETQVYAIQQRFILYFDGSVRGLTPGSPVEFRGIQIGHVADVRLVYDGSKDALQIPVVIEIEPERIGVVGEDSTDAALRLQRLVKRGLRAQLQSGSLLTGTLVVDLDFRPAGDVPFVPHVNTPYPEIPTVAGQMEALTTSATAFLQKLQKLPLDKIGNGATEAMAALKDTLEQTKSLSQSVQKEVVPALTKTVNEAQTMLRNAQRLVGPESVLNVEMRKMLNELSDASRSLRLLADHLERHPEDLIRGRSTP